MALWMTLATLGLTMGLRSEAGGGNVVDDGLHNVVVRGAFKWPAAGQSFKGHNPQRRRCRRGGRRGFISTCSGRHVKQGALQAGARAAVRHMRHSEVNNLHRVVFQHDDVGGLDVAVDQALFVRGLQSPASLRDDVDRAFHGQALAGRLDQLAQRKSRQQGHDEVRLHGALRLQTRRCR